jgi:hypothetical protein
MLDVMRMRAAMLLVLAMTRVVACRSEPRAPVIAVDTRPDAAAPPIAQEALLAAPPLGTCADAVAHAKFRHDTTWEEDPHELDANGDGTPECVVRACFASAACDVLIYMRVPGGVRLVGEVTAGVGSSPRCVDQKIEKDTFCRLRVDVQIHGETQQRFWRYAGSSYVAERYGKPYPRSSPDRQP